jgi:3-dehydroquinate synthetase
MQRGEIIRFDTPLTASSPYFLGEGIADRFAEHLKAYAFDRCFLVTSPKLFDAFGRELHTRLIDARVRCDAVMIGEGEAHKGWDALSELCEELVRLGATKDSIVIALGGGAVGNLVGLASALTFRGIRFVEVPTTVMAQTDSTLSNKQAINGATGKNHFGVYHAPLFIWADTAYPRSEPARQQRAGVVEGIKNVLISRPTTGDAEPILEAWQSGDVAALIHRLIQSKLPILRNDPTERASAVTLEYGHTFGHSIEFLSRGSLFHGEAIAIGMCLAARLSHRLGYMDEPLLTAHDRILGQRLGAPTRLPESISPEVLYEAMCADNKRTGKGLNFLLLRACGQFVCDTDGEPMVRVDRSVVMDVLRAESRRAVLIG